MNRFHKVLFVLAILIANCISASAIEFTVNGLRYSVNNDNKTVTVAGYPLGNEPTGDLTIPESVTFRGISFPVTLIGGSAFSDCSGLTSVTIPSSVLHIGDQAFSSCNELTEVVWNAKSCNIYYDSNSEWTHPFYNCLIMKLIIGDEVQRIPSYLMYKQIFLTSVTIPNSVTYIGNFAFEGCSNLTSVIWNAKNCSDFSYDSSPFKGLTSIKTFKVGNEVERIPAYLCYRLTGLTSVTIPNSVTSIGNSAFSGCTRLTSVVWNAKRIGDFSSSPFNGSTNIKTFEFGSEVERIPARLCDGLTGLTSLTIGNSVTSIGSYAFNRCTGLTSVTIPNSVTYIDSRAFYYCTGLTSIKVESGNSVYDSRENCNAIIETATNTLISGCKNTIIPNSVTSIGWQAFYNCTGLTSVTIPNSVTSIGGSAFYNCSSLTSVTFGNSVTEIGEGAFSGTAWYDNQPDGLVYAGLVAYEYKGTMPSGTSIVLKEGTKGISGNAFSGCSSLTSVTIGNSVTSIGANAFNGCTGLTNVTIGNSVNSIGWQAFYNCSGLTSVTIPNSVNSIGEGAFISCKGLTSVTIPNSVTSIGDLAFGGCSGLTSIKVESGNSVYDSRENCNAIIETATNTLISGCKNTIIPNSVTSIGDFAFENCTGLTSVIIPNSVTSIGDLAFSGCSGLTSVTIPNSVTYIGRYAFSGTAWYDNQPDGLVYAGLVAYEYKGTMPSGTSIVLKEGTKGISGNAFYGCSSLTSVTIPNSVTTIGDYAFYGCNGLTSVSIPNSVTEIGHYAFYGCKGLTSVTIPNSVTSIGDRAFYGCSGLTSVTIGNPVTSIGDQAFDSTAWYCNKPNGLVYAGLVAYKYKGTMPSCTSIVLKEGTKGIAGNAFYGCRGLTSVSIPNSVTSIGKGAFYECSGLTSVIIPNSVTSIGKSAFCYCTGLTSVTIPNSVTSIGDYTFYYCYGLTRINAYPNPEKVSIGASVFLNVRKDGTLHVLPKYLSAYRTTSPWRDFTHIKDDLTEIGGDINLDGKVNVTDVTTLVNMIANGNTANLELADINADGKVNVSDVTALVNIILK